MTWLKNALDEFLDFYESIWQFTDPILAIFCYIITIPLFPVVFIICLFIANY